MKSEALHQRLGNSPFLHALRATPLGTAAVIIIPFSYRDMVRQAQRGASYARTAVDMAFAMGAECVSLAGLLASALDYGENLGLPQDRLTTGHATTAASILKTVEAVLASVGRAWRTESVAVLGVGSIGHATIAAALAQFGTPRRLILSDLVSKEAEVRELSLRLQTDHPGLEASFVDAAGEENELLYRSSLVIGCTSTPNVLRADRLRPGCIVVDDSVPHCFDVERALVRAAEKRDVVLANGGIVRFREPFRTTQYAPPLFHDELGWAAGVSHESDLTSCALSPLLMSHDPALPATLGKGASISAVSANSRAFDRFSLTAPPVRCAGRSPSAAYLAQFAERFGEPGTSTP
ncbi:hypothetical protein ACWEKM_05635 [Streptomyces sp. NPDC004752]